MSKPGGVTITGLRQIRKNLKKIFPKDRREVVLMRAGQFVRGYVIKELAEVVYGSPKSPDYDRTGLLKEGVTVIVLDDNTVTVGYPVVLRHKPARAPVAEYSVYVEYGTEHMPERKAWRPAKDKTEADLPDFYASEIQREMRKAAKR